MLQQYRKFKEQYPEALLLFRLGDFYELFGEDALVASKLLELTLTSREIGKGQKLPMCGVPHHALQRYLARLLKAGYKAAICEQVEDPRYAKKLVKRDVVRVLTPGTLLEDDILQGAKNNYLAALAREDETLALALLDVSTGDFSVTRFKGAEALDDALAELERRGASEVVLEAGDPLQPAFEPRLSELQVTLSPLEGAFLLETPREILLRQFKTHSLEGFGLEEDEPGQRAAALVLAYLKRNQLDQLDHVRGISSYSTSEFMLLDADTRRNLELVEPLFERGTSLYDLLAQTKTRMGARLLKRWLLEPLRVVEAINERLEAVQALHDSPALEALRQALGEVYDLERLTARLAARKASPRDLVALRLSLERLPEVQSLLAQFPPAELLKRLSEQLLTLEEVAERIKHALVDEPPVVISEGGLIRPGYSAELDELREKSTNAKQWIADLQAKERQRTGIKNLKIGYNSVFGYYLEVTKANLAQVPEDYIRKQTLTNAERFITPELKEFEEVVLKASERLEALEERLFLELREDLAAYSPQLVQTARAVAQLDVLSTFARLALERRYVKPVVDASEVLEIKAGRHPVVEATQEAPFVPNDVYLDSENQQLLILTGPNMAGKSTYLRQVALIVLMAQVGCFVPADSARIGVIDRIFTRIGARDDLASGRSTFMVEMTETANLLNNATPRSLVVLDEVGRGTSTFDGLALAWAVCEYLHNKDGKGVKTLFATHYHHLNELEKILPRARNYRIEVQEKGDDIVFLRRITPGATDRSYGLQVARLAGLPQEVIERAKQVLWTLEQEQAIPDLGPSAEAVRRVEAPTQLVLFELAPDDISQELLSLDLDAMTPLEALNTLNELKQKAHKKRADDDT